MSTHLANLFREDDRAVAPIIGFILLFGILTISFAGYQAEYVPQQNAETEFQHYESVQDDMIVLRNSILRAGETNTSQVESVQLGTRYRERILALNPPDPRGRLTTSDSHNITFQNQDIKVSTRFLEYRNGYNELNIGPVYYENSVIYLDERDRDGNIVIIEDQDLVTDTGLVRVTALQNEYQRSAVGRASVRLEPGGAEELNNYDRVNISIPTRLNGSEYWDDEIGDFSGYEGVSESGDGINRLHINVSVDDLRFTTVGINEPPQKANQTAITNGINQDGQDRSSQKDNDGVGLGGISTYSEQNNTATISQPNGRWGEITCTDGMILSDGSPASKPNGNNLQGDVIRISGRLTDDDGTQYTIDVKLARDTDGSWNTKKVIIYDDSGNNVNAELTPQAASVIYETGDTDLLSTTSYDDPDTGQGSFTDYLTNIQSLSKPVTWQTTRMVGRVDLSFECPTPASNNLYVQDGSTPSGESRALEFKLINGEITDITITDFEITTPAKQNSAADQFDYLSRQGNNKIEVEIGGGFADKNKGQQFNVGTEYPVDSNAIIQSNGGTATVVMQRINGNGGLKLTYYKVSDKSQADITVTLRLSDDSTEDFHFRVTNVNS